MVSDPGVIAAGHTASGIAALERAGIETHLFDGVHENPTTDDVAAGVKLARRYDPEVLVGLGGGSSMDCCKGINFVFTNGGEMKDYWGVGKALKPMLPMIAVPTTAGTGSETQSFALISDAKTHVKMACGDKKASCRIARARSGADGHAAAASDGADGHRRPVARAGDVRHVAPQSGVAGVQPRGVAAARRAILRRCLTSPQDLTARGSMLLGASFAGLAIENSMLGAAHALANPLTTHFRRAARPGGGRDAAARDSLQRGGRSKTSITTCCTSRRTAARCRSWRAAWTGWPILWRKLLAKAGLARRCGRWASIRSSCRTWRRRRPSNGRRRSIRGRSARKICWRCISRRIDRMMEEVR